MDREEYERRLGNLPKQIIVGLAARCGRRVQALATAFWKRSGDAQAEQCIAAIDLALRVAEDFAFEGAIVARGALGITKGAVSAAREAANSYSTLADAALAAADATEAAYAAYAAAAYGDYAYYAMKAYLAAAHAYDPRAAHVAAVEDMVAAEKVASRGVWRINPWSSGPLSHYWPDGEPTWLTDYVNQMKSGGERPPSPEAAPEEARPEAASPETEQDPPSPISGPLRVYFDSAVYSEEEKGELLSLVSELYSLRADDRLVIDNRGTAEPAVRTSD